jgi:hypothetical protein
MILAPHEIALLAQVLQDPQAVTADALEQLAALHPALKAAAAAGRAEGLLHTAPAIQTTAAPAPRGPGVSQADLTKAFHDYDKSLATAFEEILEHVNKALRNHKEALDTRKAEVAHLTETVAALETQVAQLRDQVVELQAKAWAARAESMS